ncbi:MULTISPECIES: hypothetical protein [Aquimarina]|nr:MULTISPECIES: hypothetical protein [Aquimarina]
MKNVKKSPAEFLGAKVLSPMDQDKLKGGFVTRTGGQQQQQQQQQQVAV